MLLLGMGMNWESGISWFRGPHKLITALNFLAC